MVCKSLTQWDGGRLAAMPYFRWRDTILMQPASQSDIQVMARRDTV